MNLTLAIVVLVLLVPVAAGAALVESAYTRLGRARAQSLDDELAALAQNRERVLGPAALLRLVANATVVVIAVTVAGDRWGTWGRIAVFVVAVLVLATVTSALPRRLAIDRNDLVALRARRAARRLATFWPLRVLAGVTSAAAGRLAPGPDPAQSRNVSEEELRALAEVAAELDVIESGEARLIESIIELGDTITREVMVPRPDMVTVRHSVTVTEALDCALRAGKTRLPVCGDDGIDDIVGVVLTNDLASALRSGRGSERVSEVKRTPLFVPETKRVTDLMREMQDSKVHMAVVIDEYGSTAGLVTLEDLIEELVGEIADEFDQEISLVEELPGGGLRVSGRMPVDEFVQLVTGELPEGEFDTVGGLLFDLLGHVPVEGESAVFDGRHLTAERVRDRRIEVVLVSPVEPTAAGDT